MCLTYSCHTPELDQGPFVYVYPQRPTLLAVSTAAIHLRRASGCQIQTGPTPRGMPRRSRTLGNTTLVSCTRCAQSPAVGSSVGLYVGATQVSNHLLVGLIVSRFPEVPTLRLLGFPYSSEGVFECEIRFFVWGANPRARRADLSRFARLSACRPTVGWLRQPTCRLKPVSWLKAPTD